MKWINGLIPRVQSEGFESGPAIDFIAVLQLYPVVMGKERHAVLQIEIMGDSQDKNMCSRGLTPYSLQLMDFSWKHETQSNWVSRVFLTRPAGLRELLFLFPMAGVGIWIQKEGRRERKGE